MIDDGPHQPAAAATTAAVACHREIMTLAKPQSARTFLHSNYMQAKGHAPPITSSVGPQTQLLTEMRTKHGLHDCRFRDSLPFVQTI